MWQKIDQTMCVTQLFLLPNLDRQKSLLQYLNKSQNQERLKNSRCLNDSASRSFVQALKRIKRAILIFLEFAKSFRFCCLCAESFTVYLFVQKNPVTRKLLERITVATPDQTKSSLPPKNSSPTLPDRVMTTDGP